MTDTTPTPESGYIRRSLGTRIAAELDARGARNELYWHTDTENGALVYVITPGKMWAPPKPPTLRLTPGETAEWLDIPVQT